ncbi:putative acyl-coA-binding protein [Trichoderma austrokoningii]
MSTPESPEFTKAVTEVKQLTEKPSNDELLTLYALFKIASGAEFNPDGMPSVFQFKERAKWQAWKKAIEEDGITDPAEAQKKYIELVEELKVKYQFDPNKTPE